MEKLDLFRSKKEYLLFAILMVSLSSLHVYQRYLSYQNFHKEKFYHTYATVLNHYQKRKANGKIYHVLKIKTEDGALFYTTSYEDLIDLKERSLYLGIITDKIGFLDYLRTFYAPTYDLRIFEKEEGVKQILSKWVSTQHSDMRMQELFLALFLAEPISKTLRQSVAKLGISHLIAISGFHLGVLFGLFYFLLKYPYSFFQERYFPYRNIRFDLTVVILVLLFGYLWMLDFIPSLLRSFVMLLYGFFLFHRHFKILSFEVLFVTVLTILVLFPSFLFSIGFWFSVAGVFYIYLFLHHFGHLKPWQIVLLLNVWVYLLMIPIVHLFFDIFTYWQILSPLLSILFSFFYPIEIFLHFIGEGDLLDRWIVKLLDLKATLYHFKTPLRYLLLYLFFSIVAIFEKRVVYLLLVMSVGVYWVGAYR